MKQSRILPFAMSQKISDEDLANVSAAGSCVSTVQGTYGPAGADVQADFSCDF